MKGWTMLIALALLLGGCAGECVRECKEAALAGCDDSPSCFQKVMSECVPVCQGAGAAVTVTEGDEKVVEDPTSEPEPNPPLEAEPKPPKTDDKQAWPPQ